MVQGFNIDAFKSNYTDLSRQYLFMCMINWPGGVGGLTTDQTKYLCQSTSLPEATVENVDIN